MASTSGTERATFMEAQLTAGGYQLLCEGARRVGDEAVVLQVCKFTPISAHHPQHENAVARLVVTDGTHVGAAFLLRSTGFTVKWNPNKGPGEELVRMPNNDVYPFVLPRAVMHIRRSIRVTQAHPIPAIADWYSGSQAYESRAHLNDGLIPVLPPAVNGFNPYMFELILETASGAEGQSAAQGQ